MLTDTKKEVAIHRKAINDGFSRIESWIKLMIGIGGGTIFSFGLLAYEVMIYDVAANKDMVTHIERVVARSEQKMEAQMESLKLSTKSEMDNLKCLVELAI
ncbi:hypothetical protein HOY80DRAFT_891993 [Tuber brumale]|nr:hypothetical protein HOY80DRAFT_891993 [Tuber brumale]